MINLQAIKTLCKLSEKNLKKNLVKFLTDHKYVPVYTDKFIIAEGALPICLVAHMDTVFARPPQEFFYDEAKNVLWSPQGAGFDDRAGIHIILTLIIQGYKPSVIFTSGEEIGGVGAKELIKYHPECPFLDCKALIELDRAGEKDSVFYDCDNQSFENYINKFGFETDFGTYSDICFIAPEWRIAAVNLSVGYENEHSLSEHLYCNWTDKTIGKVGKILSAADNMPPFAYVPSPLVKENYNNLCCICGRRVNEGYVYDLMGDKSLFCKDCYKTLVSKS